jgi:hypothetical protein
MPQASASPNAPATRRTRRVSIWTPALEARVLRLYLQEGFTASEVADALGAGFSRGSVIGKVRRLGHLKRHARGAVAMAIKAARIATCRRPQAPERRLPPQRPPIPLPPLREVGAVGTPARLADLPLGACRWPIDDPGPGEMHRALFCAGPAADGIYCAAHRALSSVRSAPAIAPAS